MKSARGNVLVILLAILAIAGLSAAGYFYLQTQQLRQSQQQPAISQTTQSVTPVPTAQFDPTANWKTYTNSKYGYSFKFPDNWYLKEFGDIVRVDSQPLQNDQMGMGPFYSGYIGIGPKFISSEQFDVQVSDPVGTKKYQGTSKDVPYIEKIKDLTIGGKPAAQMTEIIPNQPTTQSGGWYEIQINKSTVLAISTGATDPTKLQVFKQLLSTFKFL